MNKFNNLIIINGAAPDTSNMGVSALCHATVSTLNSLVKDIRFIVFDHGFGVREWQIKTQTGIVSLERCGAKNSKKFYQPESLINIRFATKFGGLGNPGATCFLKAKAFLDISGGDSFTELYGADTFKTITLPKLMALENNTPLILLPQTYGPFFTDKAKQIAVKIIKQATQVWARDQRSYEVLKDLLGNDFNPHQHRLGVDVAFLLEAQKPNQLSSELALNENKNQLSQDLHRYKGKYSILSLFDPPQPPLTRGECVSPISIGFNISGLIFNNSNQAKSQYGLKADYRQVVIGFLQKLIRETDAAITLIPHVLAPKGHEESDSDAIENVIIALGESAKNRFKIVLPQYDQCEIKWIIGQTDWFCGTRMHSTIAALSSGIPTAAIAYSSKTLGVFETCGQGKYVADPRLLDTEEMIEHLWQSFQEREIAKISLQNHLPQVLQQAQEQMKAIADLIKSLVEN